jgi:hypothetical protein
MKTRIHFEVLNLSKMVLNYRKNFVGSCTINFIMQTAVMGTKYRSGFHFIFDLRINLKMIVRNPWVDPYGLAPLSMVQ